MNLALDTMCLLAVRPQLPDESHCSAKLLHILDFMNAQYFAEISLGTPAQNVSPFPYVLMH
jgi:hypothetical protein